MDEDGDGEDLTPFWVQSTADLRRGDRLRRGVAAVFLSSGLVVFLLLVIAVFFLVFIVPKTLSFSANIFRPNSVKKSWDSLNVVLVLVAVVFGFLSRNKNEERESEKEKERERGSYFDEFRDSSIKENESQESNANKWYNYSSNLSLRRNSSSYPDVREISPTDWGYGDYQRRYYDDIYVDSGRVSDPGQGQIHHRRHRSLEQVDYLREIPRAKTVIVDTLVRKSMEATNPPPVPPLAAAIPEEDEEITNDNAAKRGEKSDMGLESFGPILAPEAPLPPPPAAAPEESQSPEFEENQRRAYVRVARKRERSSRRRNKNVESPAPITTPPPPPPPVPEKKKRGGGTGSSSAKDFLNSLYNNKKKKKQRQKSVDNLDSLLHEAQPPLSFQIPLPSPPPSPPPPPPSAFQNLFLSKKQKRKRTITVRLEPYPPAPPPPPPRAAAREPKPTSQAAAVATRKPPKPIKMNSFDEASNSGGESPLNRIPPPPPPPPPAFFKSPAWKFVVEGDYVRVNSTNSSRSVSPDPDETESDVTPSAAYGGDAAAFHPSPLFCPSPDVNTKAESFITNFRAKLKLEKNDSMKKREPGLSSLGPRRI